MRLWAFAVAGDIRVVEHCNHRVEAFFRKITPAALLKPRTWRHMNGFVKIVPDGDVLPIRSKFSAASNDWQVGLNHVYTNQEDALWYSIPDAIVSILLTGRIPKIVDAFLIEPCGKLPDLTPTKLRGIVEVKGHIMSIILSRDIVLARGGTAF
jgi:hypothetical protein